MVRSGQVTTLLQPLLIMFSPFPLSRIRTCLSNVWFNVRPRGKRSKRTIPSFEWTCFFYYFGLNDILIFRHPIFDRETTIINRYSCRTNFVVTSFTSKLLFHGMNRFTNVLVYSGDRNFVAVRRRPIWTTFAFVQSIELWPLKHVLNHSKILGRHMKHHFQKAITSRLKVFSAERPNFWRNSMQARCSRQSTIIYCATYTTYALRDVLGSHTIATLY